MPVFHTKVTEYITSLPSPQKEICQSLRELLLENFPQMREEFKGHVTVELFYGAHLQDSQGWIVGMGKNTRHMKFKSLKEFDSNYVVDLVQQSSVLSQASMSTRRKT